MKALPALLVIASSVASAATISVNFTNGGSVDSTMLSTDIAGVTGSLTRVANWNNVAGSNGTTTNLIYADGSNSGASVQISGSPGTFGLGHTVANGDDRMWKGYIDFGASPGGTISLSNLALSGSYDVFVYFDGSNGTNWRTATFTIGSTSITAEDSENTSWGTGANTAKAYQLPVSGGSGNQTWPVSGGNNREGNYVVFSGISGSSFTLGAFGAGGTTSTRRAPVSGIQIVQVPEPSAALLGGLGVLVLIRRRRSA